MDFTVNDIEWKIFEMPFDEVNEEYMKHPREVCKVNAFIQYQTETIFISEGLEDVRFIKELTHELTHLFIAEHVSPDEDRHYSEEDVAIFNGFYFFSIMKIVCNYMHTVKGVSILEVMNVMGIPNSLK